MTRIGVFGGTFDPIHIGHLAAVEDAAYDLSLDRLLFVPNRQPPHKPSHEVSDTADRVAMVELAVKDNPLFAVSSVELERPTPSYSIDTLRDLRARSEPGAELYFLVGCDALPQLDTWHEPDALLREFQMVVMDRPTGQAVKWRAIEARFPEIRNQVQVVHVLQLEISSREIRKRVKAGRPIRYYVPDGVERYIHERGLYRPRSP